MTTDALRDVMAAGWVRSARAPKHNRLKPGVTDLLFGPWHVVLAQDHEQTWCGKRLGLTGPVQRTDLEPGELDRSCSDCQGLWDRGSPFPRPNPAIATARSRVRNQK